MVKRIVEDNKELFYCEDCLLLYKEKEWAEKCEEWCKEQKTCNIEITKHSIKKTKGELYG